MQPERWRQIAELYEEACELSSTERLAFVAEAAAHDEELRREVESLMGQNVTGDGVLERVALDASLLISAATQRMPATIGRYRVLSLVGEGGMGLVYEAEQDHPRRIVALKVLRTGLTSAESLWRFDLESMALGRLQHPGIARIYEAGTADSETGLQPYFAMELIRGRSIVEDADARHLNTRQRLQIMAQVADAVQHAHQRGIIHRDLKPSNILVDESGQPRIVDFGVALLTDATARHSRQTDLGELIGTLAYMSPEQVLGDSLEVDARSDIYALGIIMYELLAGKLPYKTGSKLLEAVRVIREERPAPLGRMSGTYRGDLEVIVAKALEKDKTQRYGSAAELAMDLRRFLNSEPILARAPTLSYQLQKFAGRHKGIVISVAVSFLVVLAGIVAVTNQSIRASRAERAAVNERDRATEAEHRADKERDRALQSEQAATDERNRALDAKHAADTQAAIAKAVSNFLQGDLLSQAGASAQASSTGKPDPDVKVRTALDRAAARIPGKFGSQPEVEASVRQTIGMAYQDLGLYTEAQSQLQRAVDLRQRVLRPGDPATLQSIEALARLGNAQGKFAQAKTLFEQVLAQNRVAAKDPAVELDASTGLAQVSASSGDYSLAAAQLERALKPAIAALGPTHPAVLTAMTELTAQYANQGKFAEGASLQAKILTLKKQTLGPEHPETLVSMDNLAYQYRQMGDFTQAEALFVQALAVRRRVLGPDHPETLGTMNNLGRLYYAQGKYAQAEPLISGAFEGMRRVLGPDHPETLESMNNLAALCWKEGDLDKAEVLFNKALEAERRLLNFDNPSTISTLLSLSRMDLQRQAYAKAAPLLREALKAQEHTARPWMRDYTRAMLGASLSGQRQFGEAEPLLLSSHEAMVREVDSIPAENRTVLDLSRNWIIEMYQSWGKTEEATVWQDHAAKP